MARSYDEGGNASPETEQEIHGAISALAEYVAEALETYGISHFAFPLFRPYNAIFAMTKEQIICVGSPLSGGLASIQFYDWREGPSVTLSQVVNEARIKLGWTETFTFELPMGLVWDSREETESALRQFAADLASNIKEKLERTQRRVSFQPIFRTSLEELELDDSLCFALMPFDSPFNRIYDDVIRVAVDKAGLRAVRADKIFSPSPIVEDIWVHIATSRLIIADVTGKNPNVFYELGLAHAVGKAVIIITQSKDDVPFDIGYIRYFRYSDDQTGWVRLAEDLRLAIAAVIAS